MAKQVVANLNYKGISPWEIEVIYKLFSDMFYVDESKYDDEGVSSFVKITIPIAFNETFFKWFGFQRWTKVKAIFKEMKRRRAGIDFKIEINFTGKTNVVFIIDVKDKIKFDDAVDKIDFITELLPYHLDIKKVPSDIIQILYEFDSTKIKWRAYATTTNKKKYTYRNEMWELLKQ